MKSFFILISFLLLIFSTKISLAQNMVINGYVTDSTTGEKLIGAYVYDITKLNGTATNEFGFYSLTLKKDTVDLVVSYIGFEPYYKRIIGRKVYSLNILLRPSIALNEVKISSTRNAAPIQQQTQMSTINIPIEQIKRIPALMGEVDVMKVIQLLPGVAKGGEGTSGIYVRGGGPDQNLILLDGVPVYNVNHLFGFFSVFNGDALNNVSLIKGGFPARYGGRLSSVIDISMKEGNNKKLHGEGGLGIISSRLTLEGPIKNEKTTFLIAARRTYIDLLLRPLSKIATQGAVSVGYYFYDLNAKVNHKFSNKDRLYLSAYLGRDVFSADAKDVQTNNGIKSTSKQNFGINWGNRTAALRWNHLLTPKLFVNTTATYSRFNFKVGADLTNENVDLNNSANNTKTVFGIAYLSGISDWGLKSDFDFSPATQHHIRWGVNYTYHTFSPGVNQIKLSSTGTTTVDTAFGNSNIYANEGYVYAEDDWEITKKLKVNVGLHLSGFVVNDTFYKSLQPRLSARYLINDDLSIKLSVAKMTQYLHLLSNSGLGLPTDLWLPVTKIVVPQQAWQYAIGAAYTFKEDYEFSLEGYYKNMKNVIEYKNGATLFLSNADWQTKVTAGKGWCYGGEALVQKKFGKTTGWIGYTLSWAYRQFDEKNRGEKYFYKYDRRHDIGVVISHQFNTKWDVSGTWVYSTGNALTLATEKYNTLGGVLNYGGMQNYFGVVQNTNQLNNYRMPSYHRMDLGANRHAKFKWGELIFNVSIYNVYSRLNAFFVYQNSKADGTPILKKVSLFPIIPAFTLNFKF